MAVLGSAVRGPKRFVEIAVAISVAIALVLGIYVLGRAIADDDSAGRISAAGNSAAVDGTPAVAANAAAAPNAAGGDAQAHAHAAALDDRGFSTLENGEQHAHTFTQPISKADRAELARQLTLAREAALRYPTVKDAEAAGLHRAGPFSPGLGAHYVSYGNSVSNPDGAMSDDDISKPLAWIYDGTKPDSHIAGLFYMTGSADPTGFAGPNDTWHVHHDICIKPGPNGVVDSPLGADHDATKEQCDAVGGNLLQQTQYLLHAWVVPGYESPEGVFSHLSSTMTCDDGTYNTISDVTKVGSATTICADGTE